jgi:hypothetical protein
MADMGYSVFTMKQCEVDSKLDAAKTGYTSRRDALILDNLPVRQKRGDLLLEPKDELLNLLTRHNIPFTWKGPQICVDSYLLRRLYGTLNVAAASRACLPSFEIDAIMMKSWFLAYGITHQGYSLYFESEKLKFAFAREFAHLFGIPYTLCWFTYIGNHIYKAEVYTAVPLLDQFKELVVRNPHDIERVLNVTRDATRAYKESVASFSQLELKCDYKLVELRNYQEMAHVCAVDKLDFQKPLPCYWFDPTDFPCSNPDETELRKKLALPNSTHEKLTHVITCGFPAGALFLRCQVEPQPGQPGGGFEYIYLHNVSQQVHMTHTRML